MYSTMVKNFVNFFLSFAYILSVLEIEQVFPPQENNRMAQLNKEDTYLFSSHMVIAKMHSHLGVSPTEQSRDLKPVCIG